MSSNVFDNIIEGPKRFEIFVPKPKARINLGAPNLTEKDEGPFGYSGVSIQSGEAHLYMDANKHTLLNTGLNYCGQAGGTWVQFSNADMTMSATASVNLSASKKIVIAAGAGSGAITPKDHGDTIRLVGYNNLELHYQVDAIQTSLYEFFHGRRKHVERGKFAQFGGVQDPYFDADASAKLAEGFIYNAVTSLRELAPPTGSKRAITDVGTRGYDDCDPVYQLDGPQLTGILKPKFLPSVLEFGFSDYFKRLDPYALIDTSSISNPFALGLAKCLNAITRLRRFADVTLKYAHFITDNVLVKRAVAAMEAINNLASATSATYTLTNEVLTYWVHAEDADPDKGGRDDPLLGGKFVDEFKSGMDARIPQAPEVEGEQASITSNPGPFAVSDFKSGDALEIVTEHPPRFHVLTLDRILAVASAGKPAVLTINAGLDACVPAFRVRAIRTPPPGEPLSDADRAELEVIAQWLSEEKLKTPVSAEAISSAAGQIVWLHPYAARNHVRHSRDDRTTLQVPREIASHWTIVTLERVDHQRSVTLRIDGTTVVVALDSADIDYTADEKTQSSIREMFAAAVGTHGVVTPLTGGKFEVRTIRDGSSAVIEVLDGDSVVLTELQLLRGVSVQGTDPVSPSSLTQLTAEQFAEALANVEGLEATANNGSLVLKSAAKAQVDKDSKIEVRGNIANKIFPSGKTSDTKRVTDDQVLAAQFPDVETAYKNLIAWNFELQKLPEDTRNLVRPVREAIGDVVSTVSQLEKMVENATDVISGKLKKGLPTPKKAIGLIANDGISLGTQDRIVGAGGKGIVFIADGGSGTEDHAKFFPKKVEQVVNDAVNWDPIDKAFASLLDDPPSDKPPSLGFRVYSDSTVDLFGTYAAQLMALGRGKINGKTRDNKTEIGVGVARIAGSHAVDIAGYRRVVIGARNAGTNGKDGGQLDLLGQTIFVGGFNKGTGPNDMQDFTDKGGLGLEPLEVAALAGAEHLDRPVQDELAKQIKAYGWTKELLTKHAPTNYVRIHAAKETTTVVGGFMIHLDRAAGLALGTRKDDKDPAVNAIDKGKAHVLVTDKSLTLATKDGETHLFLDAGTAELQQGTKAGPRVFLDKNAARLDFDKNRIYLQLTRSGVDLQHDQTKVSLKPAGVEMKGTQLTFNGQQIRIG